MTAALRNLSQLIVWPLLPATRGYDRWFIGPDDQLWLVPWAALLDDQNRYLVGVKRISYVTSGRELCYTYQLPAGIKAGPAVALFDPKFDLAASGPPPAGGVGLRASVADQLPAQWPRLFGTALEGVSIEGQLEKLSRSKVVSKSRADATEEFFLKQVDHPVILFFATHGFFLNESPQSSAAAPGNRAAAKYGVRLNPLERCG